MSAFFFLEILKRTKFFVEDNFIMNQPLKGYERIAAMEALSDVHAANKANQKYFIHKICKEPLMTMNLVLYFRKNFYLSEELNKKIQALVSSGIIDYWLRRLLKDFQNQEQNQPSTFNIAELAAPFTILIIGYCISFTVFLFENFLKVRNNF